MHFSYKTLRVREGSTSSFCLAGATATNTGNHLEVLKTGCHRLWVHMHFVNTNAEDRNAVNKLILCHSSTRPFVAFQTEQAMQLAFEAEIIYHGYHLEVRKTGCHRLWVHMHFVNAEDMNAVNELTLCPSSTRPFVCVKGAHHLFV